MFLESTAHRVVWLEVCAVGKQVELCPEFADHVEGKGI
jgi:hypothetical protein